jgi:cytochrome d ubiquinol oxidase subunit I
MAGVASWLHLRGRPSDVARASLRLGTVAALASTLLVMLTGDRHARQVAHTQEAKFAAMEGLYSSEAGAPLILFSLPPTQDGRVDAPEIAVTKLTSFLAFGNFQAPVTGLDHFPKEDWPPVAITFLSFHNMVILGNLMLLLSLAGVYLLARGRLETSRRWQRLMLWAIPLPTIAIQLGWMAAEVGRQPWIVYGVMRTDAAVSRAVKAPEIAFSIGLFSILYALLGSIWIYLLCREIAHGPEPAAGDTAASPAGPAGATAQEA